MASVQPYEIVLSLAGHDKGKLFCVIGAEGDFLLLADGKGRKLDAPKRKRTKHVRGVGTSAHPGNLRIAERRAGDGPRPARRTGGLPRIRS